jgi:hypothetical protein
MLLTKLRAYVAIAVVAFVGAGVVGLAYRTTAAEPSKAAARPADDDLEALRLEVEALRKSLQATRERVKALEKDVQGLQARPRVEGAGMNLQEYKTGSLLLGVGTHPDAGLTGSIILTERNFDANPLAQAEAALKQLRANPDDKQAVDALEKALQRLKERARPEGTGEKPHKQ